MELVSIITMKMMIIIIIISLYDYAQKMYRGLRIIDPNKESSQSENRGFQSRNEVLED
jgi:hypothetical protein